MPTAVPGGAESLKGCHRMGGGGGDGRIFPKPFVPFCFIKTFRMNLIQAGSFSLDIPLMLNINRSHVSGKTSSPFDSTTTVPRSTGRGERTTLQLLIRLFCLICHVAIWRPATGQNCHVARWSTENKLLLGKISVSRWRPLQLPRDKDGALLPAKTCDK